MRICAAETIKKRKVIQPLQLHPLFLILKLRCRFQITRAVPLLEDFF